MTRAMTIVATACLATLADCGHNAGQTGSSVLPIVGLEGKVVCVGDSLTAAEGVRHDQGFTAKLDRRSDRVAFIQQGRSGWASTSYLRRMNEVLRALPSDADVIIIQLGANDLRIDGHSDKTIVRTARNVGRIADIFKAHAPGARIVIMAPPTMIPDKLTRRLRDAGFCEHSPSFLGELSDAYRDLAARRNCGFIDLFDVLDKGDTIDGAHPNDSGHTKIADKIWRSLTGESHKGENP